jgi:hypothetical protein
MTMRTVFLAALLAAAAAPAIGAGPDDHPFGRSDDRRAERAERAESKSDRRGDDGQSQASSDVRRSSSSSSQDVSREVSDTPRAAPPEPRTVRFGGGGQGHGFGNAASDGARSFGRGAPSLSGAPATETAGEAPRRRASGDTVREWRIRDREREDSPASIEARNLRVAPGISEPADGALVQPSRSRPVPRAFDSERRISRTPVFTEPPRPSTAAAAQATPRHRWSSSWRHDRRYDWRDWRHRNRSLFRLGFYYDPFGWDYRRYSIGWRLWPSYYRSSFWLNDPWQYRLPPAYGPYRWIRYHGDALLVNIYTGEVVDVVYDFFW